VAPVAMVASSGTVTYNYFDQLGSAMVVSDASGNPMNWYAYLPFGDSNPPNLALGRAGSPTRGIAACLPGTCGSPASTAFGYAGYRYDAETGMYHAGARYYDPRLGRFIQPDPFGQGPGLNVYAYVNNDPLNLTDPSGELSRKDVADYLNGSAVQMGIASAFFYAQPIVPFKIFGPIYAISAVTFKAGASVLEPDLPKTALETAADVVADRLPIPPPIKPLVSLALSDVADTVRDALSRSEVTLPSTGLYIGSQTMNLVGGSP
jgi:RHS repeat-associated protein